MLRFAVIAFLSTACQASHPHWISGHYNGDVFNNTQPSRRDTLGDEFKIGWELLFKKRNWPEYFPTPKVDSFETSVNEGIRVTFIGHSTTLIQVAGVNILTDPVLFDHVGLNRLFGMKSVTNPAVDAEALPSIDIILVSHDHYDHLDLKSLKKVTEQQKAAPPKILVGLGNGSLLQENDLPNFIEMDWDDAATIKGVKVTFLEAVHTSRRGLMDQNKTLWGSFMMEAPSGNIYFSGDTAYGTHFKAAYKRFGAPTLALLPVGAYLPRWFMQKEHQNPEEAVLAHLDLNARQTMGIHCCLFDSAGEGYEEQRLDVEAAKVKHRIADESFVMPRLGQILQTHFLANQP